MKENYKGAGGYEFIENYLEILETRYWAEDLIEI